MITRRARLGIVVFWLLLVLFSVACWYGIYLGGRAAFGASTCQTVTQCQRALDWQKHDRTLLHRQLGVERRHGLTLPYIARIVEVVYGVPAEQVMTVGRCESGLDVDQVTDGDATGWLQFLGSTWRGTPFGRAGFKQTDALAEALQAGRFVSTHHGSWSASGGWSESFDCHHLR